VAERNEESVLSAFASPVQSLLDALHQRLAALTDGALADYIPPLALANPAHFGMCLVTADGQVYQAGDTAVPFTIQSISKPFAFALALESVGWAAVMERVGVEPSGDAFNSIVIDEVTGRPFNPMVNAGAIVTTDILRSTLGPNPRDRLMSELSRFAGRTLDVDHDVFEAERLTGNRNRAIGFLLRSLGTMSEEVEASLGLYFEQCSLLVDARDLAMMGATLANGGRHPVNGDQVMGEENVARVLSVMSTCGMYDYAGQWLYQVRPAGQERRQWRHPGRAARSVGLGGVLPAARQSRQQRAWHRRLRRVLEPAWAARAPTPHHGDFHRKSRLQRPRRGLQARSLWSRA
jgi:glutaminase